MKILVLDDDEVLSRAVARTLAGQGHRAVVESDPGHALDMLRAGEWFDLVLCDRRMPAMCGDDFIRQVRDMFRADAPMLVMMTGDDDIAPGPADVALLKPFSRTELCGLVALTLNDKARRSHSMTQRLTKLSLFAS